MRFFNLDLHIGVIGDIKQIFTSLGHDVTNWTISGHAAVLGREMDRVDVVNATTWQSIDKGMCDAFYERYRSELSVYDAFIVTHTPCFSMLYERWNKPIICVASTRYEHPFSHDRAAWEQFNAFLRAKIDEGILIPIANNRYDAAYAEYFTQRQWQVIPSICDYTNAPYTGSHRESLYFSKFHNVPDIANLVAKDREFKERLLSKVARRLGWSIGRRGYSWNDLAAFRNVVYIPYNSSIMSIFELYTSAVPMLFPSQSFAADLYARYRNQGVLSELSFNQVRGLPSGSAIPCDAMDPNNFEDSEVMMHWLEKADYYDPDNMAGLIYFDSFDELEYLLRSIDVQQAHETMVQHNRVRKQRSYSAWKSVLATIAQKLALDAY